MNIEELKRKRPFWFPKFAWNYAVGVGTEAVKAKLTPNAIADTAAALEVKLLRRAVHEKDKEAVHKVARICGEASNHVKLVSKVIDDGEIDFEEQQSLSEDIAIIVTGYVSQEAIAAKIDEVAKELRYN